MTTETTQSAQLESEISQLETKSQEFGAQLETAKTELAAARGAIDFTSPATVTKATSAQAKFTVIAEARAEIERRLVELGSQHAAALEEEREAAKQAQLAALHSQLEGIEGTMSDTVVKASAHLFDAVATLDRELRLHRQTASQIRNLTGERATPARTSSLPDWDTTRAVFNDEKRIEERQRVYTLQPLFQSLTRYMDLMPLEQRRQIETK